MKIEYFKYSQLKKFKINIQSKPSTLKLNTNTERLKKTGKINNNVKKRIKDIK